MDLIIQILKFRNVNVTHECICLQLDTPGSFELIKNNLFLILMSIFLFFFLSNDSKIKTTRATQQFVPYMHIHKRTDWFFPKLIKT